MAEVAVIILNWNGRKLLEEFLPSVVQHTPPAWARVVVADNASQDDSVAWLKHHYPQVSLICLPENYGFAGGYNRAIEQVEEEIVVLLNSDVQVTAGWLSPLVDLLKAQPDVAAVQPKIRAYCQKDCFEYAGACGGYIDRWGFPFCRGRILNTLETDNGQYDDVAEVFWCSGAALCIRREKYRQAGGLDERFFAHMEEIDLCWRLRNRGEKLKVCPASVVYHLGGGSLPMDHPRKLFLNYRNNLLMLYKNLSPGEWKRVACKRKRLDLLAAFLFLLKGERAQAKAVRQAYREFQGLKDFYTPSARGHADNCIFQGSIIFKYYIQHVRKFSQLRK